MESKQEILDYLRTHRAALMAEFQLTRLGVFGSFARDEQGPDSDVDLLVDFEPGTGQLYEKKQRLKAQLQGAWGRKVDLCREKYLKPYFKAQILQSVIDV